MNVPQKVKKRGRGTRAGILGLCGRASVSPLYTKIVCLPPISPPLPQATLSTMAAPAPPVAADPARTADPSAYSGPDVGAESGSKQEEKLLYTFETLAQHNTREDLWMLLHDKVYNVTAFMDEVSYPPCSGGA